MPSSKAARALARQGRGVLVEDGPRVRFWLPNNRREQSGIKSAFIAAGSAYPVVSDRPTSCLHPDCNEVLCAIAGSSASAMGPSRLQPERGRKPRPFKCGRDCWVGDQSVSDGAASIDQPVHAYGEYCAVECVSLTDKGSRQFMCASPRQPVLLRPSRFGTRTSDADEAG